MNPGGVGAGPRSGEDCEGCVSLSGFRYRLPPEVYRTKAPGVVHRVAPSRAAPELPAEEVDEGRRNVLKLALVGGAVLLGGAGAASAVRYLAPPQAGAATFPRVQLHYDDNSPILASRYRFSPSDSSLILFNYPLTNEPNMLMDVGHAAPNGVGPRQSLVAFSAICQHLGCVPPYISYYPAGTCPSFHGGAPIIHCICHGSTFDPLTASAGGGAAILTGPTQLPLPQVILEWDSATDYLYAAGVIGPPVRGHSATLSGGSPVESNVSTESPQAPSQQCPT